MRFKFTSIQLHPIKRGEEIVGHTPTKQAVELDVTRIESIKTDTYTNHKSELVEYKIYTMYSGDKFKIVD